MHVTDLHYGKYTTASQIDGIVETVNGLEADLVLLTGDLIDISLGCFTQCRNGIDRRNTLSQKRVCRKL